MALLDELLKREGIGPATPPETIPASLKACKTLEEVELYLTWCSTPIHGSREPSSAAPPTTSPPST
jgi:hypothetical protein